MPRFRLVSFRYAFEGLAHVLRTQPNAWVHAAISLAVIAAALWLNLGRIEWAILIVTMAVLLCSSKLRKPSTENDGNPRGRFSTWCSKASE